jgi:hypothetical protein
MGGVSFKEINPSVLFRRIILSSPLDICCYYAIIECIQGYREVLNNRHKPIYNPRKTALTDIGRAINKWN